MSLLEDADQKSNFKKIKSATSSIRTMMTGESITVLRFPFSNRQLPRHTNFHMFILKNFEIYTKSLAPRWRAHSSTDVEIQTIRTRWEATPIKQFFPQGLGRLLLLAVHPVTDRQRTFKAKWEKETAKCPSRYRKKHLPVTVPFFYFCQAFSPTLHW